MGLMAGDRTFSGVRPPSIIQDRWKVNRRFVASQALTSTYENRYYPVMLKRLIEVALPLKEVSEQSAREKSIRHGRDIPSGWSKAQRDYRRYVVVNCKTQPELHLIQGPASKLNPKEEVNVVRNLVDRQQRLATAE